MSASKVLRIVITGLEKQGAKVKETKKGFMVMFPDGSSLTVHNTESDHRALANTRGRVLRAGFTWPLDGK
jgi:5-enolpyruvylshikimate-3-phosphate synthase